MRRTRQGPYVLLASSNSLAPASGIFRNDRPGRGSGSPAQARATADTEALLEGPLFLTVLPGRPDERPGDDREREDADSGDEYLEERAHRASLRALGELLRSWSRYSLPRT